MPENLTIQEVEAAITQAELDHIGNGILVDVAKDAWLETLKRQKASRQKLFALISLKHRLEDEALARRAKSVLNYVQSLED